jgi:hypothetical protein
MAIEDAVFWGCIEDMPVIGPEKIMVLPIFT